MLLHNIHVNILIGGGLNYEDKDVYTDELRHFSCNDMEFDIPIDFELISCLQLVEERVIGTCTCSIEEDKTV